MTNEIKLAFTRHLPLIAMSFLIMAFTQFLPMTSKAYDTFWLKKPWLEPTIEVVGRSGGVPAVIYSARARVPLRGIWTAWTEADGVRIRSNKGAGNYIPMRPKQEWTWADFFGADIPVPKDRFRICVTYDVSTDSGVRGQFGPFCSQVFNPNEVSNEPQAIL